MKVMLIFPPQAQPFMPHPAVPLLTAVLRREGIETFQADYNLEAYEYFLNPAYLTAAGMNSFAAAGVIEAKKDIRTGFDYILPGTYYNGIASLENYLAFAVAPFREVTWTFKEYRPGDYSPASWESLEKAVSDREANPLIGFFETKLDEIKRENPRILGISVAWENQLIPAFTLAHMVKKQFPHIHITMGGSMISHLAEQIKLLRKMFSFVDSYLPFDGEIGIVQLARELPGGNLDGVPGLIYLRKKKILANPPQLTQELETLPVPAFHDLKLTDYYSPQVYLPVSASRGCYWAKCAFCSHHFSGSTFRRRTPENLFLEMERLYKSCLCKNFYFSDDALPPDTALKLAERIEESQQPFRWAAELRIEEMMDSAFFETLHRGGLRLVLFGMESFNRKTLEAMNKGTRQEVIQRVIRDAGLSEILTWVFFFLGFPGEEKSDAADTLKFLLDNRRYIDMIAGGTFALARNSPVYRNPGKYRLLEIHEDRTQNLGTCYPYTPARGMTEKEAREFLGKFRSLPEVEKFLEPFVSELHLLFFRKSYFTGKM